MNSKYIWGTLGFRFIMDAACHRLTNLPWIMMIYDDSNVTGSVNWDDL